MNKWKKFSPKMVVEPSGLRAPEFIVIKVPHIAAPLHAYPPHSHLRA